MREAGPRLLASAACKYCLASTACKLGKHGMRRGLTWRKVHIAMNSAKHSVLVLRTTTAGARGQSQQDPAAVDSCPSRAR